MQTDNSSWQRYRQSYQNCIQHPGLATSAGQLFSSAVLLSKQRDTLAIAADYSVLVQTQSQLPAALWRIELLFYLAECYRLQPVNRRLLLLAGWCSALLSATLQQQTPYPALAAARQLKNHPDAAGVVKLLSGCYGAEQQHPPWQQSLLSLLLTESEYLARPGLQAQMAKRLMLTHSENELDILRSMLRHSTAPALPAVSAAFAPLLQQAHFTELCHSDNKALEHYLTVNPQRSAPILQLASRLNRQQQNVQSVKLAIGLIGRDTLPAVLAEAQLHEYLTALHHPWQDVFSQFCHVLTQALLLFMPDYPGNATCRLLALCCCAPLWLSPEYQRAPLVSRSAAGCYQSRFNPALSVKHETYRQHVINLLELYQLHHYQAAVFSWHQAITTGRITAAGVKLLLAWQSSLTLYCGTSGHTVTALLEKTAAKPDNTDWLQQLTRHSQCYCPVSLKL